MEKITLDYVIDRVKERNSLKSDYQVCQLIETSTSLMSGWRAGKSLPDERYCKKLAEAAGLDPLVLAASMQAQRSKTEEARSMWATIAERLQTLSPGVAAALLSVAAASSFVADDAYAASATEGTDLAQVDSTNYTLCIFLAWFFEQLLRTFRDLNSDSQLCLQP